MSLEVKSKSDIRKKYKELRSNLSSEKIDTLSQDIAKQLFNNFNFSNCSVHLFISIKKLNEVNTEFLMNELFNKGATVSTSAFDPSELAIRHVKIYPDTKFNVGNMDIPIPDSTDIELLANLNYIIVPLLSYDINGNRIGYGKGIYDKILSKCNKNCKKIGLSIFEPEKQIPIEPHDIKLDFCQTPVHLYHLK